MKRTNRNFKKAFSLIELSIVILIISILITGILSASTTGVNNAKIKVTNERIKEIYKALGSYLLAYNKLPCPASVAKIKSSDSDYGTSVGDDGDCSGTGIYMSANLGFENIAYGMVPVKTLKISIDMAEDGFESKFGYMIDERLSSTSTSGFSTATLGVIVTKEQPSNSTGSADLVIISYGANKLSAFDINSSSQTTNPSDSDEEENDIENATPYFNGTVVLSSTNSEVFDDILFAVTREKMMVDFGAMSAMKCLGTTSEALYGSSPGGDIDWPVGEFGQEVVASDACPSGYQSGGSTYPTRRCSAFGQWGAIVNPCSAP